MTFHLISRHCIAVPSAIRFLRGEGMRLPPAPLLSSAPPQLSAWPFVQKFCHSAAWAGRDPTPLSTDILPLSTQQKQFKCKEVLQQGGQIKETQALAPRRASSKPHSRPVALSRFPTAFALGWQWHGLLLLSVGRTVPG